MLGVINEFMGEERKTYQQRVWFCARVWRGLRQRKIGVWDGARLALVGFVVPRILCGLNDSIP